MHLRTGKRCRLGRTMASCAAISPGSGSYRGSSGGRRRHYPPVITGRKAEPERSGMPPRYQRPARSAVQTVHASRYLTLDPALRYLPSQLPNHSSVATVTGIRAPPLAPRQRDTYSKNGVCQSGRRDLNPRPLDPQSSALPSCATSRNYPPGRAGLLTLAQNPQHLAPRSSAPCYCANPPEGYRRCRC